MSTASEERLYNLLPELYRRRDLASGETLRAILAVLESQFKTLEGDITAGYNNWFAETCDAWVLPYLAELVGMTSLSQEKHVFSTQRRQVANTIGYRRRKGTIATLEHVLRDATNWLVCAVEYDQRLQVTQHLASAYPHHGSMVDVRWADALANLGGPFDEGSYTAQISRQLPADALLETLQPGQNYPGGLGLYIWRLRSFRMTNSNPRSLAARELLNFLNRAASPGEISEHISDDASFGSSSGRAYGVRRSLAQRILDVRDQLPQRLFESLEQVDAVPGVGPDTLHDMLKSSSGLYAFHPLGADQPLFNWPQSITRIDQRAQSTHMPLPLSRAELEADLADYREKFAAWPEEMHPANSRYYGPDRGLNIAIWTRSGIQLAPVSIPPSRVLSLDLSQWDAALASRFSKADAKDSNPWAAIDVQLGRFALFSSSKTGAQVSDSDIVVTYCYGFSTSMGGGPYHRQASRYFYQQAPLYMDVAMNAGGQEPHSFPSLKQALQYWMRSSQNSRCFIRILDNGTYDEELEIRLADDAKLSIVADNGVRPVIGKIRVAVPAAEDGEGEGERELHLDGLLIHGGLQIEAATQDQLTGCLHITLENCTLVTNDAHQLKPAAIEAQLEGKAARGLRLSIESSIVGPLYLPRETEILRVSRSIVDGRPGHAIAADPGGRQPGPVLQLERSTIFGCIHAQKVTAADVLCTDPVQLCIPAAGEDIQHSYIPEDPNLIRSAQTPPPRFTSTRYGDPGYAQLSLDCPGEIRGGAADGSELGAFHDLHQLQAEKNLGEVLDEYLPLGLEPSVHYIT
jgi:hypothetical protein